jgi:signal transduction histidine kinase
MTILLVTPDEDAGQLLSSALKRANRQVKWVDNADEAALQCEKLTPAVLVVDTILGKSFELIQNVRINAPWVRAYLIEDSRAPVFRSGLPVLPKPFDVAEVAQLIGREVEAADIDRRRHSLEERTGELVRQQQGLERELEHAERLAALGRIAASMAHEINNPLAVVQSSASYVRDVADRLGDIELSACAADIELAADRISTFVEHVCGFARREQLVLSDVALDNAIEIALRLVRPRAKSRGVTIDVEPIVSSPVPHDPPRIAQGLLNLLSNAIDASAGHGNRITLRQITQSDNVIIQVDDTGTGIDPSIAERLFEPFVTTKPPGEGTGLGLAITHRIMEDHGGYVRLLPCSGGGTRAELCLPLLNTRAIRVLVIDPDALVQRALTSALRAEGFTVTGAASFGEASSLAGPAPRIVITDARLPDVQGADLVQKIRQLYPSCRVLVIAEARSDIPIDADGSLRKPWTRAELVSEVRNMSLGTRSLYPMPIPDSPSDKPPS